MPLRMQVDLLRVLQEGAYTPLGDHRKFTIDFRILCSSKLPLEQLVESGRLREDLFYRLQVISISLPDLKDRLEDVPLIAANIARTEAGRLGLPWSGFSPDTLTQYSRRLWPGNIRELEQEVRRLIIVGNLDDGPDTLKDETSSLKAPISRTRENEREQMMAALEKSQWNKTRAAQLLGMPRRTFYRRLKEYNIIE
jgi:DNA-binding NtrC family response regulator